jgi:hypothetical protein
MPTKQNAQRVLGVFVFGGLGPYRKTRCKPRQHWFSVFFENSGYKSGYNRSTVVFLLKSGLEPQPTSYLKRV